MFTTFRQCNFHWNFQKYSVKVIYASLTEHVWDFQNNACGILINTPNWVYNKVMTPCQVNINTCCWVSIPGIFLISFLIGVTLIPSALRSRWACFIASIHLSEFSIVPTTSLKEITDNRYINYIPLNVPKNDEFIKKKGKTLKRYEKTVVWNW